MRKYYRWKKYGVAGLENLAKAPRGVKRHAWETVFMRYCENDKNTSKGAYNKMMLDFQNGVVMEGIGDWRKVWAEEYPNRAVPAQYPLTWKPRGVTYQNLMKAMKKNPDLMFQIQINRQGMQSAHQYLLDVHTSRVRLPVGKIIQFDDVFHNTDVLVSFGASPIAQPLEFVGWDVASGFKVMSVMKPRITDEDGKRKNLKEREFRFGVAGFLTTKGFHKDGVNLIGEHGTAAFREKLQARYAKTGLGGLIKFPVSSILNSPAHSGLFAGIGGGNFRMKALCEGAHNILHNRTAALPGGRGRDAAHMHESHAALVKYETKLHRAAADLPEEIQRTLIRYMLTFDQYTAAFYQIQAALMDDPDHGLEGWDGRTVVEYRMSETSNEWHPRAELLQMSEADAKALGAFLKSKPACNRERPMTRREVWMSGQDDLVTIDMHDMPLLLMPDDAMELKVRDNGTMTFRDQFYYGRDEVIYHAKVTTRAGFRETLIPGRRYRAYFNPGVPDHVWIEDMESGKYLGMAPRYHRAPLVDQAAINRAMGGQIADRARKMKPIAGRHHDEALALAERVEHNAQVLAGTKKPERKKSTGKKLKLTDLI